eukprot:4287946-Prymnesium_polylepis.2
MCHSSHRLTLSQFDDVQLLKLCQPPLVRGGTYILGSRVLNATLGTNGLELIRHVIKRKTIKLCQRTAGKGRAEALHALVTNLGACEAEACELRQRFRTRNRHAEGCHALVANLVAIEGKPLELRHRSTDKGCAEGLNALVADLVGAEANNLELRYRAAGEGRAERLYALVTYLVVLEAEESELCQRAPGKGLAEGCHALVTDLIVTEVEVLHLRQRSYVEVHPHCLAGLITHPHVLQAKDLEVGAQAEAPTKAPPILHARWLHACIIKIELLDAAELVDAHLAEQRLDRALVSAIRELLGLYQHVKVVRAHGPVACRSLCLSLNHTQPSNARTSSTPTLRSRRLVPSPRAAA